MQVSTLNLPLINVDISDPPSLALDMVYNC